MYVLALAAGDSFGSCFMALLWLALSLAIGGAIGLKFKGQQQAGTLLGLLGPIGWICVILLKDKRRHCPACMSALNPGAVKCARCGTDAPLPSQPAAAGGQYGAAKSASSGSDAKNFVILLALILVGVAIMLFVAVRLG